MLDTKTGPSQVAIFKEGLDVVTREWPLVDVLQKCSLVNRTTAGSAAASPADGGTAATAVQRRRLSAAGGGSAADDASGIGGGDGGGAARLVGAGPSSDAPQATGTVRTTQKAR